MMTMTMTMKAVVVLVEMVVEGVVQGAVQVVVEAELKLEVEMMDDSSGGCGGGSRVRVYKEGYSTWAILRSSTSRVGPSARVRVCACAGMVCVLPCWELCLGRFGMVPSIVKESLTSGSNIPNYTNMNALHLSLLFFLLFALLLTADPSNVICD